MADVVDLTADEDEQQQQQQQQQHREDEQARQRIMAFAAAVNPAKRPRLAPPSSPDAPPAAAAIANNSLLAQLHAERMRRNPAAHAAAASASAAATPGAAPEGGARAQARAPPAISLLQFNVWFNERAAVEERMAAIGGIVEAAGLPHVVCFQEVTAGIQDLLESCSWWGRYTVNDIGSTSAPYYTLLLVRRDTAPAVTCADAPFANSAMGRGLRTARLQLGGAPLVVATTHLESPCPPDGMFTAQRKQQMGEALSTLDALPVPNVLFAGDMNWTESRDGRVPLPPGWQDAWQHLRQGSEGFTYEPARNPMLLSRWKGSRLDRVLCKLRDWRLQSIEMVGTDPIPGATYEYAARNGKRSILPVLPSDHFGLLVRLQPTAGAPQQQQQQS